MCQQELARAEDARSQAYGKYVQDIRGLLAAKDPKFKKKHDGQAAFSCAESHKMDGASLRCASCTLLPISHTPLLRERTLGLLHRESAATGGSIGACDQHIITYVRSP